MNLAIYPPLQVLTALFIIMMGVSVKHTEALIILLALGAIWLVICRVPIRKFGRRMRAIIPFLLFSFVCFYFYEGASTYGMERAFIYSSRLIFTVQVLTLLFSYLSVPIFLQSLVKLKLPAIFVELASFTLRFMEVIRDEALRMLQALRSRGMRKRGWFSLQSYSILSHLLGSLLLRSLHRSERIYHGMMSRGYSGVVSVSDLPAVRASDLIKSFLWLLPVAVVFIYDLS